ncbi:MAG: alcohol dehydrogenase catalytic domain-containing protein, partial [Pseudomonadales bacterium]
MRAIVLESGRFRLEENYPTPEPAVDEALVRVRLAAVCGTDLELARGYYTFSGIPGHEFVGEIAEGASKGQR